ncbi:hypothetical protein Tco_0640606 [Tanacetum coccineum]
MSQLQSSDQLLTATQLVPIPLQIKIGKCNSKADMNNLSYQQEVDFTLDTFRIVLQLPQETAANPFMPPTEFLTIKKFLKIVGYEAEVFSATKIFTKNLTQ